MIDFIQLVIYDFDLEKFLGEVEPDEYVNHKTGEIKYPIIYKDGPLSFIAYPDKIKIKGSIHKYWNFIEGRGEHNHNDFDLRAIRNTMEYLINNYNLEWSRGYFINFEFGLNIVTSFVPKEVINLNIFHLKGITHSKKNTYRNTGMFKEFDRTEYWLKVYSKGDQFQLDTNILRLEVKLKTRRSIEKHGLKRIEQLTSLTVINSLYLQLWNLINDLCVVDKIEPLESFSDSERTLFNTMTIAERYKNQKITRAGIKKRNERFEQLLELNNLNGIKKEILNSLELKFNTLVNEIHNIQYGGNMSEKLTDSTKNISGNCKLNAYESIEEQKTKSKLDDNQLTVNSETSSDKNRIKKLKEYLASLYTIVSLFFTSNN